MNDNKDEYIYDPETYRDWVKSYQERGDPLGWFEALYKGARGDHTKVFWADLQPNPYLLDWMMKHEANAAGKRAIAVGCGVGDDAEALSAHGYQVTAFDISPAAIDLCRQCYRESRVDYLVADLFAYPPAWREAYDLVYECNTIQVLPGAYRTRARDAMISLMAPGGNILVSCRSRNRGELTDAVPLPLDRDEIDGFRRAGNLEEVLFIAYDDDQEPPVPHFFACYRKPD
ncbi:MAG: class I SAM-dependent methyltransferase [Chromatiaceae bacterium]|nr:class I SAM-dependent methyltransferase [Chromatiaceae bacterium]